MNIEFKSQTENRKEHREGLNYQHREELKKKPFKY